MISALYFWDETTMEKWIEFAAKCGFTDAFPLDITTLIPLPMVRAACAADKCQVYGKNWTCPPHCGSLDECTTRIHRYQKGILLRTVGKLDKSIDTKGYIRIEAEHTAAFRKYAEEIRKEHPQALCLGAGGCRFCEECAYPNPCRFPEKAMSSMEGYGLFVTQICRDNGVQYYYGPKTISYFACVLF